MTCHVCGSLSHKDLCPWLVVADPRIKYRGANGQAERRPVDNRCSFAGLGRPRRGWRKFADCSSKAGLPLEAREVEAIEDADPDAGSYERNEDGPKEFPEANRSWLEHCIEDAGNAQDVTARVHGMSIVSRDLERLDRIEAHFDAKMQRLLGLLQLCRKTSRSPRTSG